MFASLGVWRARNVEPIVPKAMRIFAFACVCGLAASSIAPLYGQSLVDVAKKEQERRQGTKTGTKVYTNGDLKPVTDPDSSVAAAAAEAGGAADKKASEAKTDVRGDAKAGDKAASKDDKAASKSDEKGQEYWSAKMKALSEQLDRDRLYAEAIQTRINSLTAEFSAKDDPAQRALIGEDREKAVAELARLRKQIDDDKDAIGSLEEEARKANVPPGWLR